MISIRLLHSHNPLIFVASANFLLGLHTPASLSPSLSILSLHRANSSFHFRSFTHGVCRPPAPSLRHTLIDMLPLFSYHRPCLTPTPLFIDLVVAHSFPLDIV